MLPPWRGRTDARTDGQIVKIMPSRPIWHRIIASVMIQHFNEVFLYDSLVCEMTWIGISGENTSYFTCIQV